MRTRLTLHMLAVAVLGLVATAGAQLSVVNGNFSDLTGLTGSGSWRTGVPYGWSSTAGSPSYSINIADGPTPPTANLQSLTALSQTVGTLTNACDVVLMFDFSQPWSSPSSFTASILTNSAVMVSKTISAVGSQTLVAANAPSGASVSIKFVNQQNAPGLDNVQVLAFGTNASPVISQQPAVKTAMLPGTTASLSVTALGVPPLSYQWRTNGVALADATNATLTVNAWSTNYTVAVTAPNGASVTSVVAQVIATVINGDFSDLTGMTRAGSWCNGVPVGWIGASNSYFVNTAEGATPPIVNLDGKTFSQTVGTLTNVSDVVATFDVLHPWTTGPVDAIAYILNGNAVVASNRYTSANQGTVIAATMTATNVPAGTALTLKFVGRSGSPGLDNVTAAVFATNAPPSLTRQPQARSAMPAGTSVTLSVGTAGMPPLRFQWQTNNADVVGATNAALTVTVPGNYSAVATAPNGASVTSGVAQVIGSVLNGTFSDLSGLRDLGGSWYFGVPADWICTSFPTGNMYAVNSASGPTPPVCNPSSLLYLRQQVGTLLKASHVVLTFDAPNAFSQPSAVLGAAILDTALQPLATAHCVPGLGYRLVAPTVPRGTTLTLQFWADTGFPGLDNVSVSISQPGTVMTVR